MGALESRRRWSVVWRTAALHAWLVGLGFGLPCVYAIWYFADQGLVWTFMGFPTYGEGPFEDVGLVTTVPLLVAFLLVCLAELVMGWLLWSRRRSGVVLSLVLLPLELAFWIGFLLPYGFVVGAARTVLVLIVSTFTNRPGPSRRIDHATAGPEAIAEQCDMALSRSPETRLVDRRRRTARHLGRVAGREFTSRLSQIWA